MEVKRFCIHSYHCDSHNNDNHNVKCNNDAEKATMFRYHVLSVLSCRAGVGNLFVSESQ